MKIIIAGAGEVGTYIAHMLATEEQDTYLIDNNKKRLDKARQHNDIIGLEGDAKDIAVLIEAGVESCDLLIAATSSEETNLLICILGKKLGAKKTISRISNFEEIGEICARFTKKLEWTMLFLQLKKQQKRFIN